RLQVLAGVGLREGCVHRRRDEMGRPPGRSVRAVRQRDAVGHQSELQREGVEDRHDPASVHLRRRRPELHERRAGRRRHRAERGERGHADRRHRIAGAGPGRILRPDLERQVYQLGRVLASRHRQQRRADAELVQGRPVRTLQPALYTGEERARWRRAPVGQARELLRRLLLGRLPHPVLVQIQLLVQAGRIAMSGPSPFARRRWLIGVATALAVATVAVHGQQTTAQSAVNAAYAKFKDLKEGKNADYIPALAQVDPNLFGIAIVMPDGNVYTAGDVATQVSIQSISKVFTMAQVIQEQGLESIEKRIGVDATGARFNSIIAVEGVRTVVGTGAPEMNPLVNPGAISATSMVTGSSADQVWNKIIGFHNDAAGRQLSVLQDVYKSESDSNQRNQAIGALMLAYGYIKGNWQEAVDLYTRQCSIGVNAQDLATMAATLAAAGKNPITHSQVIDAAKVPNVLAVMSTAGLYDDSGKWLYHTGLPAKSGVGGGIIAVSPGKFGIAVVSPPLDDAGNSVRAQKAIADISNALNGNPLAAATRTAASSR